MKENDVIIHSNLKVAAQLRIAAVLLRKTGRRRPPFAVAVYRVNREYGIHSTGGLMGMGLIAVRGLLPCALDILSSYLHRLRRRRGCTCLSHMAEMNEASGMIVGTHVG